jgi:hypothetical protein
MQLDRENSIELQNQADDYSNVQYLVSTESAGGNSQTTKPSYLMNPRKQLAREVPYDFRSVGPGHKNDWQNDEKL